MRSIVHGMSLAAALGVAVLGMGTAQAQSAHPLYFGLAAGQMILTNITGGSAGNTTNIGVLVGMPFVSNPSFSAAVEGELTTTLSKGSLNPNTPGASGTWDDNTVALYGVLRTGGHVYFKAKAGYVHTNLSASLSGYTPVSISDSGSSYGIGIGWRLSGGHRLELGYTRIASGLNYASIGYIF